MIRPENPELSHWIDWAYADGGKHRERRRMNSTTQSTSKTCTARQAKLPKVMFDYIEGGVEDERGLERNGLGVSQAPIIAALSGRRVAARPDPDDFRQDLCQPVRHLPDWRGRPLSAARRRIAAGRGGARRQHPVHHVGRQQRLDGRGGAHRPRQHLVPDVCGERTRPSPTRWSAGLATTGCGALVLTVDVPIQPRRERNIRNGLPMSAAACWRP